MACGGGCTVTMSWDGGVGVCMRGDTCNAYARYSEAVVIYLRRDFGCNVVKSRSLILNYNPRDNPRTLHCNRCIQNFRLSYIRAHTYTQRARANMHACIHMHTLIINGRGRGGPGDHQGTRSLRRDGTEDGVVGVGSKRDIYINLSI